LEDRTHICGKI